MREFLCLFAVATLVPVFRASGQDQVAQYSPVQRRVAAAEKEIQGNAKSWQGYNDLAFAFCRVARDNGDISLYDKAQAALNRSFQIPPANREGEKLQVTVLLGKHEFAKALKLAAELNNKAHDDIGAWGLLVDANIALGNYAEAERDSQWILDLRAGSSLGFTKAAGLRVLFGDAQGASEFFEEALRRTSQSDADERAWLLTQDAGVQLSAGNAKRADDLLNQALKLFPESQLALANLAAVRSAQARYSEAAAMLEKRYRAVPSSANLYEWAEALERAGEKEAALAAFRDFEIKAAAEVHNSYNVNRQLVFFYTDHKSNPTQALSLAAQETVVRHDSATLDAYAWALYRNGKYDTAKKEMDEALAVGIRDAIYFCHAAQIAAATDDRGAVVRFRKELASFSGNSCPLDQETGVARRVVQ